MRIVISAGHGKFVRGASGIIDEVDEARKVTTGVTGALSLLGVGVVLYWDDISRSQSENLKRIVDFHNSQTRDVDVSIHFNSAGATSKPLGTEVLYLTDKGLSIGKPVLDKICAASGLKNRGMVHRPNLYFLKNTEKPAILVEVCFVDSSADVAIYRAKFNEICKAIAEGLAEKVVPGPEPEPEGGFHVKGKCSTFGGPKDTGVASDEGLAFITSIGQAPHLFLPTQPPETNGLARRLNPYVHYLACRWDYDKTPRAQLLSEVALVRANGMELTAFPADWGPNAGTGRVADLSPQLAKDLGLETDDEVEVIFPYRKETA